MSLSNTGFSGLDSSSTESIPVTYDIHKIHLKVRDKKSLNKTLNYLYIYFITWTKRKKNKKNPARSVQCCYLLFQHT